MPSEQKITALIPAYNAAATIERALASVSNQVDRILVLDDGSTDATQRLIKAMNLPHLELLAVATNAGIGAGRQSLLDTCDTELAVWLDADDEFLPGRVARLQRFMNEGADWVFDAAELIDGNSGAMIRELPIPDFLQCDGGLVWQFARNYIPSLGWAMVRTSVAKAIGYDGTLSQAEDYDHLLRAIVAEGNIRFCNVKGYRQYHYANSVSRSLTAQSAFAGKALANIGLDQINRCLLSSTLPVEEQALIRCYAMVRMKLWDELAVEVLPYLETNIDMQFFYGVACFQQRRYQAAIEAFERCMQTAYRPEYANNLGVSKLAQGDKTGVDNIRWALQKKPNYLDARLNLKGEDLTLTETPLRISPIRDDY